MPKDLTEGSIIKSLISLSIPLILMNILQTLYQITDAFWVGQLGTDAVAAVSLTFPILFFVISALMGFTVAGTVLISQYKGQKNPQKINHVSTQIFFLILFSSFILSIIGFFITPYIVGFIDTETYIQENATAYLQVAFLGLVFMFPYHIFQALHRGIGEVKIPMYIILFAVLLNFFLDPIFINGYGPIPAFGVVGSAIVTILAQGIAAVIATIIMLKGMFGIKLDIKELKVMDTTLLKKIFKIAIPSSIQFTTNSLSMVVLIFIVSMFSTSTISAYGIGTNILNFIMMPTMGIGFATSVLVGQNIGALKKNRALKVAKMSILATFMALILIAIILVIFSDFVVGLFIKSTNLDDIETLKLGIEFIGYLAVTFCLFGPIHIIMSAFTGAGRTKLSMIISMVVVWVFRIPLAYLLAVILNQQALGIWISFPLSSFFS